jgi:hypothetical protein
MELWMPLLPMNELKNSDYSDYWMTYCTRHRCMDTHHYVFADESSDNPNEQIIHDT